MLGELNDRWETGKIDLEGGETDAEICGGREGSEVLNKDVESVHRLSGASSSEDHGDGLGGVLG